MSNDMPKRVQTLQRYIHAMKNGDIETIATLLEDAEQDRALENMLLEVNDSYQYENSLPVQQNDIVQAQHLMRTIAQQTTRRDFMQIPPFHAEDDSAQMPTIVTTEQPRSTDQVSAVRNAPTSAFPVRGTTKQKWYRSRKSWIVIPAAAILVFFVLLQSNGALASDFFSFFHLVKPVVINIPGNGEYVRLSDLGSFSNKIPPTNKSHLTKAQAAHAINFPLELPGQLPGELKGANPSFSVSGAGYMTFTFNAAKARAYLTKHGYKNIQIPANLDGATFRMGGANNFDAYYDSGHYGSHELSLSEGPIYDEEATGSASVKEFHDFLLLLPVSPLVKMEYTQNNGDILEPFPTSSQITSVTVHHVSGSLVTGKGGMEPYLLWADNGIEYSLTGNMSTSQLLAIANSMHS